MHDTLSPNVLKITFSPKSIQIRALAAMVQRLNKEKTDGSFRIVCITAAGTFKGYFKDTYCSDNRCDVIDESGFDISKVDELAKKVLIDAELELINIKLSDNGEFIKLINSEFTPIGATSSHVLPQVNLYVDHIIGFTIE